MLSATEYLFENYVRNGVADLRQLIVVVPGRRAGRRLLELLVERASSSGIRLTPPRIATVGRLPEHLYHPQRPFASELVQRLAWVAVLRRAERAALQPFAPRLPSDEDLRGWLELGEQLRRLHVQLAADRMDFRNVARHVTRFGGSAERRRWETMAELQQGYHRLLDELELWDRQTARLKAIEFAECHTSDHIVLLGTVDMNVALRAMLDQVSSQVTVLVVAPEALREGFDGHGCLAPEIWSDARIEITDDQIEVVSGPQDQAAAVVRQIARYAGEYEAAEITIGVPDERLIPYLRRELARQGVPARWGPGQPLSELKPIRLLSAVGACLNFNRFRDWAALARHPDMAAWLDQLDVATDWLTALDEYQGAHLPYYLPSAWLGGSSLGQQVAALVEPLRSLCAPLAGGKRPLADWSEPLLELLAEIYSVREFDRSVDTDRAVIESCSELRTALREQADVPAALVPRVSAAEAIELVLQTIGDTTVPHPSMDAVELLGWLELPLDDAPALIATTVNEGFVPESVTADLFLPDRLRAKLGMLDNRRRYARDAYAVSVLRGSRRSLHLITARANSDGDPLTPSRLLFATDDQAVARRALRCFGSSSPRPPGGDIRARGRRSAVAQLPRPEPLQQPLAKLSVTSFRSYLACPYRFYLRYVLGLRTVHDHAEELDAAAFGSAAHEVLRRFGLSPQRESSDAGEIRRVLDQELHRYAQQTFGHDTTSAVQVQLEQLRLRLAAFAAQQAQWYAQGWRIEHIEVPQARHGETPFALDDVRIGLTGRIDRIDVHSETGERIILDYKTSDAAKTPEQAHRRQGQWTDLQLPLYRHLARCLDIGQPKLGYILLPKDTSKAGFAIADWTDEELQAADEQAKHVIRAVLAEEFWPPAKAGEFATEFDAICALYASE